MSNKLALFGGSFDPVHIGHLKMLEYCQENFDFDQIDIIPAQKSPFKEQNLFSSKQRLEFLEKVLKNYTKVEINKIELERKSPSYTALTIRDYKAKNSAQELYMLLGSDHIETLSAWNEFEYLKENLNFIFFKRELNGVSSFDLDSLAELGIRYQLVDDFNYTVSSSAIKSLLKDRKASEIKASGLLDGLIPEQIKGLILEYYSR